MNTSYRPIEQSFSASVVQELNDGASSLTLYLDKVPSATIPSGKKFTGTLNAKNSLKENVEITSIDTTNKTLTISTRALNLGNGLTGSRQTHRVGSEFIISNDYALLNDYGDAIDSKLDNDGGNATTTWDLQVSGSNFRIRKDGNDMKFTDDNNSEISLSTIAAASGADEKVKVSSNDSTSGFLNGKIVAGDGIDLTENNDGSNETLSVGVVLATTNDLLKITSGELDTNLTATKAQLDEAGTFFGSTDISGAEAETLTDGSNADSLHTHDNLVPLFAHGSASYDLSTASGTQTIAHGLSRTPKFVRFTALTGYGAAHVASWGSSDGSTDRCISYTDSGSDPFTANSCIYIAVSGGQQVATATFDATNITLNWTKTSSPTGTLPIHWEAQA